MVGQAIRDSGVPREDVFITTKVSPYEQGEEKAPEAARSILKELGELQVSDCAPEVPSQLHSIQYSSGSYTVAAILLLFSRSSSHVAAIHVNCGTCFSDVYAHPL